MDNYYPSHLSHMGNYPQFPLSSAAVTGQGVTAKEGSVVGEVASNANKVCEMHVKPKQSKSRNGCVTCKGKRLKCDETKPKCKQCHKRGVECGGYKKDFKWRAYEETNLTKTSKQLKKTGGGVTKSRKVPPPLSSSSSNVASYPTSNASLSPFSPPFDSPSSYEASPQYGYPQEIPISTGSQFINLDYDYDYDCIALEDGSYSLSPISQLDDPHRAQTSRPTIHTYDNVTPITTYSGSDFANIISEDNLRSQPLHLPIIPLISIGSPIFSTDNSFKREIIQNFDTERSETPTSLPQTDTIKEEDLEAPTSEALHALPELEPWSSYPSPPLSDYRSSSPDSYSSTQALSRPLSRVAGSPELLLFHFDKYTCGIMSMKNGPNENPWRTLIWPLAQHTPALYHAVAAMTAFHMSRESQNCRVEGVEHVRQSLRGLRDGIGNGTISDEGALATTLVLAFTEAFDRHISTGSHHLKGAKILIKQALLNHQQNPGSLKRLQFLHNVWVYLDVLARLTSDADDDEVATSLLFGPSFESEEIDPLMGCATTLFPLIGRVANLVRKIRQSTSPSSHHVKQAKELKCQLENWVPGRKFVPPEDSTTEIVHSLKTAEAYKYATLLYLHQAIPGILPPSSHQLAKKTLELLDSVPITSGACIVHIYPLLVAGCEAQSGKERQWVQERWEQMSARMWIGNVDKAWQVVKEVWDRRDVYSQRRDSETCLGRSKDPFSQYSTLHPASRASSLPPGPSQDEQLPLDPREPVVLFDEWRFPLDPRARFQRSNLRSSSEGVVGEYTGDTHSEVSVKSRLHWVSVMKDWEWEVLLG